MTNWKITEHVNSAGEVIANYRRRRLACGRIETQRKYGAERWITVSNVTAMWLEYAYPFSA